MPSPALSNRLRYRASDAASWRRARCCRTVPATLAAPMPMRVTNRRATLPGGMAPGDSNAATTRLLPTRTTPTKAACQRPDQGMNTDAPRNRATRAEPSSQSTVGCTAMTARIVAAVTAPIR